MRHTISALVQNKPGVLAAMAHAYPHLLDAVELLKKVVVNEEERFRETLENLISERRNSS